MQMTQFWYVMGSDNLKNGQKINQTCYQIPLYKRNDHQGNPWWHGHSNRLGTFLIQKMLMSFLFLYENICCGYSLEVPQRGATNEYHNICICREIRTTSAFLGYPLLSVAMHGENTLWGFSFLFHCKNNGLLISSKVMRALIMLHSQVTQNLRPQNLAPTFTFSQNWNPTCMVTTFKVMMVSLMLFQSILKLKMQSSSKNELQSLNIYGLNA